MRGLAYNPGILPAEMIARGKTITALITPEHLALALTGKSDLPVELKLRNVEIKVK
ncbi:DUF2737 family protein [Escherichia coli]|uniref:DUF2737 family protein n=1 Tax=Escherichia coli TaxID=562 RepID=UPI00203F841B|nr:DUF2737 family protein [Escherichia coli]